MRKKLTLKQTIVVIVIFLVVVGGAPFVAAVYSYRSGSGYVGEDIYYTYVDKSHFDRFQIAYYKQGMEDRLNWDGGAFYLDDRRIETGERSFLLREDGTVVGLKFEVGDYRVSDEFSSGIAGIFGSVPHFKEYQIEGPRESVLKKVREAKGGG